MAPHGSFDNERLISEIEIRPGLWDQSCAEYSNKMQRAEGWEGVTRIFCNDLDLMSTSEKSEAVASIKKRWKNLRDNFVKDFKLLNGKSETPALKKRKYIFYDQLKFLMNAPQQNRTDVSSAEQRGNDENEKCEDKCEGEIIEGPSAASDGLTSAFSRKVSRRKCVIKKEKTSKFETSRVAVGSKSAEIRQQLLTDEDKMFLLSLLSDFKKVPSHKKLRVKSEIINVIMRAQFPENSLGTPEDSFPSLCTVYGPPIGEESHLLPYSQSQTSFNDSQQSTSSNRGFAHRSPRRSRGASRTRGPRS